MIRVIVLCFLLQITFPVYSADVFPGEKFTAKDAVLVMSPANQTVFEWQPEAAMIPASLTKLATAYMAIDKWGLGHHFETDFYWLEMDRLAEALKEKKARQPNAIYVDNSHFVVEQVPGRTGVADPYNAPLSAVSANFNTAMLRVEGGRTVSAEPQTPLTATARSVAHTLGRKTERVNLINSENAQTHFAELLIAKMGWKSIPIYSDRVLPQSASHFYKHINTHSLSDVLRGTLEYSNNFIANQLYLKFAEKECGSSTGFAESEGLVKTQLSNDFSWSKFALVDGAGLSRKNRLSARQLDDLLLGLKTHKELFKRYRVSNKDAIVHAKTGTLSDVHSFAGYIELSNQDYRFVFIFNRQVPYRYREQLLEKLVTKIAKISG